MATGQWYSSPGACEVSIRLWRREIEGVEVEFGRQPSESGSNAIFSQLVTCRRKKYVECKSI